MASPITHKILTFFWKPKWLKHAKMIEKSGQRFLNYKRDLLSQDRIDEIQSRIRDLKNAINSGSKEASKEAEKQLESACHNSMPKYRPPNPIAENIEVFFVAIVVALGLRAYVLQPFRIPTGSMQPTLNGIRVDSKHDTQDWDKPFIGKRAVDFVLAGKRYVDIVADRPLSILKIEDSSWFLFTRTKITFTDGSSIKVACTPGALAEVETVAKFYHRGRPVPGTHYQKGDPIFQGSISAGDMVFVDKFSYHFRNPRRGEVFVFDTRDIEAIHRSSGPQGGGTHYIKRLVGVPGDTMQIKPPLLYVNGEPAKEEQIKRVGERTGIFEGKTGYELADRRSGNLYRPLFQAHQSINLAADVKPQLREYYALGDNTANSLDSKYWGPVRQFNLIGPALFTLWPIDTGHWGLID